METKELVVFCKSDTSKKKNPHSGNVNNPLEREAQIKQHLTQSKLFKIVKTDDRVPLRNAVVRSKEYLEVLSKAFLSAQNDPHFLMGKTVSCYYHSSNPPSTETLAELAPHCRLPYFTADDIPFYENLVEELERDLAIVKQAFERVVIDRVVAYALTTHPGHHAYDIMGGYCYINTVSYALSLLNLPTKVAVLDVDYHFGDGTALCLAQAKHKTFFVSIHMDTMYDYPFGKGRVSDNTPNSVNYIVSPGTKWDEYSVILEKALTDLHHFEPEYLIVSLGLDTLEGDDDANKHGGIKLTVNDFEKMGKMISDKLKVPILIIQEGGYKMDSVGEACVNFLKGVSYK